MSRVYLSGPITGVTYNNANNWRKVMAGVLPDLTMLSPLRHEGHLAETKGKIKKVYPGSMFSHPRMIVTKDLMDIDTCDLMVVNLLGAKLVSIGTIAEMGYAKGKSKVIITIMEKGNLHDHPFVRELSNAVVDNVSDAVAIVRSLLSVGV